ncbi:MAG TPA: electron transfer flavoprotein subunit alpha/FixB family protein [Ktedonobacteraceae bacterium]|nr:electron transfer flavoprotein subunit alpha/FixB family protein [Ktedonobacteraceae bacterium]
MPEIWAVLEQRDGILAEQSGELLAELAELIQRQPVKATLCALFLTSPTEPEPTMTLLANSGVQRLYLVAHSQLAHYTTEGYVNTLAWLIQRHTPLLVATSATSNGRDWLPRLAARLHLPCVTGCLGLDLQPDCLLALRAIYDGRAYIHTRTALHGRTALVSLVPGVRGAPALAEQAAVSNLKVIRIVPELPEHTKQERIQRLASKAPLPEAVELEAAERIIAGGRGIGRDGFNNVAAFARLLGAAVGATRVATDRGWIEHARQIGATGKSVHPQLYIACGISGAAQHTSGMRGAQTVVAINPDRSAPIFALADLGLLGDANQILPLASALIERPSHT